MTRTDISALAPAAYKALIALDSRAHQGTLPAGLLDLVKLRVSQVNGCAYCVDSHSHDAIKGGKTPARLYAVAAWDERPFFSPAERAAFALAESMTRLSEGAPRVPDEVWAQARRHFGEGLGVMITQDPATHRGQILEDHEAWDVAARPAWPTGNLGIDVAFGRESS